MTELQHDNAFTRVMTGEDQFLTATPKRSAACYIWESLLQPGEVNIHTAGSPYALLARSEARHAQSLNSQETYDFGSCSLRAAHSAHSNC
jgi:hypothetical protein